MRIFLTVCVLLALLLPSVCRADALDELAARLDGVAGDRNVSAEFVQTRHLRELGMDVKITGSMICEHRGRLRWQIDSPLRSVTVISDEGLVHYDAAANRVSKIAARDFPWMKILRECFSDWIGGDVRKLAAGGKFDLSIPADRTLRLVPRSAPHNEFFRAVSITFLPDYSAVALVRIEEPSGDTMEIAFSDVRKNRKIPASAWELPPK